MRYKGLFLGIFLIIIILAAGCSETSTHPKQISPYENVKQTDSESVITSTQTIHKPEDILSLGSVYKYKDNSGNNDISIKLNKVTKRSSFSFDTNQGSKTISAPPGKSFLFMSVTVHHLGTRSETDNRIKTIGLPSIKLQDISGEYSPSYISITDGIFIGAMGLNKVERYGTYYRNLYPSDSDIVHYTSIGEMYSETVINRLEKKEGWLVFTVPEDFSISDSYLELNLGSMYGIIYYNLK